MVALFPRGNGGVSTSFVPIGLPPVDEELESAAPVLDDSSVACITVQWRVGWCCCRWAGGARRGVVLVATSRDTEPPRCDQLSAGSGADRGASGILASPAATPVAAADCGAEAMASTHAAASSRRSDRERVHCFRWLLYCSPIVLRLYVMVQLRKGGWWVADERAAADQRQQADDDERRVRAAQVSMCCSGSSR